MNVDCWCLYLVNVNMLVEAMSLYLLQAVVLSVHQGLPVIVKLDVMSLDVLQRPLSQHRAVLHRYYLDNTHKNKS